MALLRLLDDVYQNIDNKLPTVIVGLDISAAFDMVNHETLLDCLRNDFGIDGKVLAWLKSYLSSRQQFVKIGQHTSNTTTCQCEVLQGSVLGPLLFSVYTSPIGEVVSRFGMHFHQFADDMQIYLALSDTNNTSKFFGSYCLVTLDQCTNAVKAWYLQNDLLLNANKIEVMFVGTTKSLESVKNVTSVNVAGTSNKSNCLA